MTDTILVLTGIGIPAYSARGLTQTLEPIAASAQLRRTVNGTLRDLSQSQFRKYRSTISCTDQAPPALDGIFPGAVVTVHCAAKLSYVTAEGPQRPVVPGSEETPEGSESEFTIYRPVLQMRVVAHNITDEEWAASRPWSIELEEI
jgi:hypothetical protein